MDRKRVARELLAVAKELNAGMDRTAAARDLADIRELIPEMRKKQEEYNRIQEEALREKNQLWGEITDEMGRRTSEVLGGIKDALVDYFKRNGMGVRSASSTGGLVEVFVGSEDGVKRVQSKVSAHIALTFKGSEKADFMLRNEDLDDKSGSLSDRGTVQKLITVVKAADRKGFWAEGEAWM